MAAHTLYYEAIQSPYNIILIRINAYHTQLITEEKVFSGKEKL